MTKTQKKELYRIIIAGAILAVLMILEGFELLPVIPGIQYNIAGLLLYCIPFFIVAYDVCIKAFKRIIKGNFIDECFLMIVATAGAFVVQEFEEGVAIMLFYGVGELFQDYAVNRSKQSIKDLMDIMPEFANVERDGQLVTVDPEDIQIGETIVIRPGEKVPIDGIIIKGSSMLDTSSLTGESVPRSVKQGEEVISGCINKNSVLYVKTTKAYDDSTVSKIMELVESAGNKKAKTEKFISKFAKYYTPIVIAGAAALFIIPSIVTGDWNEWLIRACSFLVVSCPCALVISIPLGFFGGIGVASKMGILIKGGNYVEQISKLNCVVFDKTGTLTQGVFKVIKINPIQGVNEKELMMMAAAAEQSSTHPIAVSIKEECNSKGLNVDRIHIDEEKEIAGHGIQVIFKGDEISIGNKKMMQTLGIEPEEIKIPGTVCYIAKNGQYCGNIIIADMIKYDVENALKDLEDQGVSNTVMLTGDRKEMGEAVARQIGIKKVYTDLLPADKVTKLEELLEEKDRIGTLGFVGDGVNDTPVIARADVGYAMGGIGSDSAIEAADVVIMDDDIRKVATSVKIAKSTMKIVKQNIWLALSIKFLIIILSAFGLTNMWIAVFGDVGVAIICILNSMRILFSRKFNKKR